MTGEAKVALDMIQVTEPNYQTAWQRLLDRYDNTQALTRRHMELLASLRPLKEENITRLQGLHDQVVKSREALSALGCAVGNWNEWFIFFATRGMDPITRREWEQSIKRTEEPANYDTLVAFLKTTIDTLKAVADLRPSRSSDIRASYSKDRRDTRKVLTTTRRIECLACKGDHFLYQCRDFEALSIASRRSTAGRARGCYNCLRPGHSAQECRSESRCRRCTRRHHTLLHPEESRKRALDGPQENNSKEKRARPSSRSSALPTSGSSTATS